MTATTTQESVQGHIPGLLDHSPLTPAPETPPDSMSVDSESATDERQLAFL